MAETTSIIEVRTGASPMTQTFLVHFTSTLEGYQARVTERLSTDAIVPVALHRPLQQEIDPGTFYRFRTHYRTELFEQVKYELMSGRVQRLKAGETEPAVDAFLRANLRGWRDGHPDAVDDDLGGWDPLAGPQDSPLTDATQEMQAILTNSNVRVTKP